MIAYCINLDRRPDRWAHMTAACAAVGLPVQRFPAVDGNDPGTAELFAAQHSPTGGQRRMSLGAFGALRSHQLLWQRLLDSAEPATLILEDDLILAPGIAECLDPQWLPPATGVVKLETNATRQHLSRRGGHAAGQRRLAALRSYHSGAGAYLLTRTGAQALLAVPPRPGIPVDEIIFAEDHLHRAGLAVLQLLPAPASQAAALESHAGADFAATSITEHWAGSDTTDNPETRWGRVARRAREEVRAIRGGTRYQVVPFG